MTRSLLDRCEEAVTIARGLGADAAEAYAQTADALSATVEKHDLQMSRTQHESAIGIRVLVATRAGFASTNDLEDLPRACLEAVTLAKAAPGDACNVFPDPQTAVPVEGLYDPAAGKFTAEQGVEQAANMLRIAEDTDRRVIIGDAEFTALLSERAVANSLGIAVSERSSLYTYAVLATARDGSLVSNMDFQFDATRHAAEINVAPIVHRVCRNVLDSLGAEKGETFNGPVLLSPHAAQEIVVSPLLFQLNGRNVLRRLSRWGERVGTRVAFPGFCLVDNGRQIGGVASSSFDREGVPHGALTLIDDGRLASFFHSTYSAVALSAKNTAHAVGSARSAPGVGPTNLSILPGTTPKAELLSEVKRGLLVTRFSGNVDPVSGDFSGVAKGAQLIRNGRTVRPVSGTLIAGNVFDALLEISGVSQERERIFASTLPYLRLENVSVTAG